ncbi:hypothetical protein FA13DRAFT_1717702 [Coprinellus micaceus]|uniref:Uncharacterized protein n=1 Tax=Coprinellus micaceus TaxID=71717 RepID=A0A4Y7SH22_COPMI|nr:hypothetical protein FA13DRAFT_1717702 [Coprinellus micaceus]
MAPPLANEILQHIIEKLAEGPQDDWLHALLPTSQKHIFKSVTLYSHPTDTYGGAATPIRATITVTIKINCKKTRLFVRTMAENPHLGSSVRKSGFVLRAIRQLPNVECLCVGIYNLPSNAGTIGIWLDSLLGFPLESLRAAEGLKTLVLREIAHAPGEYGLPPDALSFIPKLENLVCDRSSLEDGVSYCLAMEASRESRIILSRVRKVELRLSEEDIQEEHLHPASFKTLTHLSLGIGTSLFKQGHWQGGLTILDPYLGLCDTLLANFVALETLKINLVFQGSLDAHVASSFGAQWGEL